MSKPLIKALPPKTSGRKRTKEHCIICDSECDEDRSDYSIDLWNSLKESTRQWRGLDRYGDLYDQIKWDNGPKGVFFHKVCKLQLTSQRKLQQAISRQEKEATMHHAFPVDATDNNINSSSSTPSGRLLRNSGGQLHDKQLCVWCMKPGDVKHSQIGKLCLLQQENAWSTFKSHTIYLEDATMRDRILALIDATHDPFATEIRYHRMCWKKYVRPIYCTELNDDQSLHLQNVRYVEVQQMFFKHVRQVVLELKEPRTLQGLLQDYNNLMKNFGFDTSSTKSWTIKQLLQKEFNDEVGFHDRFHKNESTIVYDPSEGGSYIEAAIFSWGVSDEQLLNSVARRLRQKLAGDQSLIWPPPVNALEIPEEPNLLLRMFLAWLRNPGQGDFSGPCQDPEILTLASLITSFVTKKRTVMKTLLSVTLHGLTRSREIVDLLKRLTIGISYQDVLNLYASWAKQDIEDNEICPAELAEGLPGTAIMDNDDFCDDTLTGANTSHRTNVMFIQPENVILANAADIHSEIPLAKASDLKTLVTEQHNVQPYKTLKRGIPAVRPVVDISIETTKEQRLKGVIHYLARLDSESNCVSPDSQTIGAFTGFHARIQKCVVKSKAYYFLTFPTPPQKSVVHEVMCRMVATAKKKSMPFIILVGDQPVYALIVQLKYENPNRFELILPFLGPFHAQMSFISAINKRFKGSGLSEVLVAADVIAEGSVDRALAGKHYKRSIRCLKVMHEALTRRIIHQGMENGCELSEDLRQKLEVLRKPAEYSREELESTYNELESNHEVLSLVDKMFEVFETSDSPMATFWLSFLDMVEILLMNIHALRLQDWGTFKASLRLMLPWLQIYDNDKYGKWLVEFWLEISCLPDDKDRYMREGLFSQSLTGKPYSCLPLDLWIEMTMNKGSKMKAGWSRILKNEPQLLIHTRTVNFINRVRVSLHTIADLKNVSYSHSDNSASRLRLDEKAVQDTDSCITEFACDPFDLSNPTLRSLQTGMIASQQLVKDFETAHDDGEKLVKTFIDERMFSSSKSFDATVHRSSRCNFSKPPLIKDGIKIATKTDAMENKAMANVIALAENCKYSFDLVQVMEHRVTDECLAIFNVNGTMRKGQKSKLTEKLNFVDLPIRDPYIALIDMGFLWRLATPSSEDRDPQKETVFTWGNYAEKIFSLVRARHAGAHTVVFVNDSYDVSCSIKDSEHDHRYTGVTKNVFMRKHDKIPPSREFNAIFKNSQNKIRLQQFLKNEFRNLALQHADVEFFYSLRDNCWDISSGNADAKKPQFECHQIEADTVLLYIYSQIRKSGSKDVVVIDAEDTDVVVLSAYVAHNVEGELGIKRKADVYDCKLLCSNEDSKIIVPLHIFTGSDAATAFFGHGKKTVFETVSKDSEARELLKTLGSTLPVSNMTIECMKDFTIKYIYKDNVSKTLAEARAAKWKMMKIKSTLRIPPDIDSLSLKIQRANYQVYLLHNCQRPECPQSPLGHGWVKKSERCQPIRHTKPALPPTLNELIITERESISEKDDTSDSDTSTESDISEEYEEEGSDFTDI